MCAKIQPNRATFRVKGLARKKVVKPKNTNLTRRSAYSISNDKISGQRELKKLKICLFLVIYLHYVCAKFHTNRTIFRVKGLPRKKVLEPKTPNYRRCSTYSASNDKNSAQRELKKLKLCKYLINWFDYVCAKTQANPKFLRVKGLAREKVVKPKSTNFTRCSTYSACDDKISSQGEPKKVKLCM